jgi:hypothetical protein
VTAADVFRQAAVAGVILAPGPTGIRARASTGTVPDRIKDLVREHREALVEVLRADPEAGRRAADLLAAEVPLPVILRTKITALDKILEVSVPWADQTLFLAPGCKVAARLSTEFGRGRVWCVCELLDLVFSGIRGEDLKKVMDIKLTFDGQTSLPQEATR